MRAFPLLCVSLVAVSVWACGAGTVVTPPAKPAPVVAPVEQGPKSGFARGDVDRTLKGGLGRFLAYVDIEAALDGKRKFIGWRVMELRGPKGTWDGVDLHLGDVVTSVNGFPIERDDQAMAAFRSLEVASEIRVSILRDGKPTELRLAIIEGEEGGETAAPTEAVTT
ncbi:MAG: PDZ domain-containing protein, partial [Polyangiales bacterium]